MLNKGVEKIQYVNFRPTGPLSSDSVIEFNLPATTSEYINLKDIKVHMKLQITKPDDTPIDGECKVGFIATPLHSMFSQVDVYLQNHVVTSSTNMYPYRAYISKLLGETTAEGYPQHMTELYVLDGTASGDIRNNFGQTNPDIPVTDIGRNEGLTTRARYTALGRIIDVESKIYCDVTEIDRYILNGVPLRFRFFPTTDSFRLLTMQNIAYKVKIVDMYLRVPMVTVSSEIIIAQDEILKTYPAKYPFHKWEMLTYTIPKGQYTVTIENPFQGKLPSKVYLAMTPSLNYNGHYKRNPYHFKDFDLNTVAFLKNGQSIPYDILKTEFSEFYSPDLTTAYQALLQAAGRTEGPFDINYKRFNDGFTILGFNIDPLSTDSLEYWKKTESAHTRLELRFGSSTPEPVNLLVIGISPEIMTIDHARNVSTSAE